MSSTKISQAQPEHAVELVALINNAYRGDISRLGWTSEADLLTGARTNLAEIQQLVTGEHTCILISKNDLAEIVGAILLQRQANDALFSMLSVNPYYQAQGLGKQLLQAAEDVAGQLWQVTQFKMQVIACRKELIAYYQRRGYQLNGEIRAFPENPALWQALVPDLALVTMHKLRFTR